MTPRDLEEVGASIILGNTYHLHLRPGDELIRRRGGLAPLHGVGPAHPDRQRRLPGVQPRRSPDPHREGVEFQSHLDGSRHLLTPESAVDIQLNLGSDIAMVLDECPACPPPAEDSIGRSTDRALGRRCRAHFLAGARMSDTGRGQLQFGIVQGGTELDLRAKERRTDHRRRFRRLRHRRASAWASPTTLMYKVIGHTRRCCPPTSPAT
jgi:queuine tRNA-ribosyltransferase